MKIIALSQVYYPDTASVAQHLTDLLEELIKNGHDVSIITSRNNYENPTIKYKKIETHNGVTIERLHNTGFGKQYILGRLIDYISFNIIITIKMLFRSSNNYEVVLGLTTPPLLSFIGIIISKLQKKKFIYWTMDLQPELSIVAGYVKRGSISAILLQRIGDFIFNRSDLIITLDRYMEKHIQERIEKTKSIAIIPVWPVMNRIFNGPRDSNPFRKDNGFGEKIVIMYSGNHSVMHPILTLLEAAILLKDDLRFLFVHIGSGVRLKEVKEYKSRYKLNNITILPYQPRELIHLSLGASDFQVVTLGNECVGYTHPNKVYGAMFIGKPIIYIGPNESHISDILDKCPGNISIRHGESNKLADLLSNRNYIKESYRNEVGLNNQNYANNHFSPILLKAKMVNVINNLVEQDNN